jgi:5-methyltetrahydropteroyltriglutamate--homocysteine methyltransferase
MSSDGEQARELTYVQHRLSGYGGESDRPLMRDMTAFPTFVALKWPEYNQRPSVTLIRAPKAIAEVKHVSSEPIEVECDELARLLKQEGAPFAETFMTAASPGIIAVGMLNDFYPTEDEYVLAVADAMRHEYEHILSRGFVLQLDCPDLAMERHSSYADRSLDDFKAYVRRNVAAINRAIEGMLKPTAPRLLGELRGSPPPRCAAGGDSPAALRSQRRRACAALREPATRARVAGAGKAPTTTQLADRGRRHRHDHELRRAPAGGGRPHRVRGDGRGRPKARAGGRTAVSARLSFGEVAEEVVWLKMRSLVEGAELASKRLFS